MDSFISSSSGLFWKPVSHECLLVPVRHLYLSNQIHNPFHMEQTLSHTQSSSNQCWMLVLPSFHIVAPCVTGFFGSSLSDPLSPEQLSPQCSNTSAQ
eukprot:4785566-Prorocentrum_lima.AAC.1